MKKTIINPIIKDVVTFVQTSEESGGKVSEANITLAAGGGNLLHYHKTYTETFTAIKGQLGLKIGKKETRVLSEGESYTVDPMTPHSFFNPTDEEITFSVKLTPGHSGFENSLRIIYGLAVDGLTDKDSIPKSLRHTAIVLCMGDVNASGLTSLLFPLFRILATISKYTGEEQRLIDRYCK